MDNNRDDGSHQLSPHYEEPTYQCTLCGDWNEICDMQDDATCKECVEDDD